MIDQGATGATCMAFDRQAEVIGRAYRELARDRADDLTNYVPTAARRATAWWHQALQRARAWATA